MRSHSERSDGREFNVDRTESIRQTGKKNMIKGIGVDTR